MSKQRSYKKHGLTKDPLYKRWMCILSRCYNAKNYNYKYYGKRGIRVCDKWRHDFKSFYDYMMSLPNAMGKRYTIDRIDNNGNYEPGNVRWVDQHTQILNRGVQKRNKSGYTGILFREDSNQWRSRITFNRKVIDIGSFNDKEDALIRRNKYIIRHNLPHAIQEYHG